MSQQSTSPGVKNCWAMAGALEWTVCVPAGARGHASYPLGSPGIWKRAWPGVSKQRRTHLRKARE